VRGDGELLEPAGTALCRVGSELQELGCNVHLLLSRLDAAVRLRLRAGCPTARSPSTCGCRPEARRPRRQNRGVDFAALPLLAA
jgi:hypothetical protein